MSAFGEAFLYFGVMLNVNSDAAVKIESKFPHVALLS